MNIWSSLEKIVDNWLGKLQYGMGKYYLRRGNYPDAVVAFKAAEEWYIRQYGQQHYAVVASLIQQGWCYEALSRREAACCAYRRALEMIEVTEGPSHQKAREIRAWLASNCTETLSATVASMERWKSRTA